MVCASRALQDTTFTSLKSQKYVKLTNRSDVSAPLRTFMLARAGRPRCANDRGARILIDVVAVDAQITAHFEWKLFESSSEEEEQKMQRTVALAQQEAEEERQLATDDQDRFGQGLDLGDEIEGLGPLALATGRKYKQLRKAVADDKFLFDHPIFSIEPRVGEIWPNSTVELVVTFSPEVVGDFQQPVFLQVSGREDRLPLHLAASGVGPKVTISYDKLEIGNVFIGSQNEYEVVLMNDGRIPAEWHVEPNESTFGKMFTLSPSSGTLNVNEQTAVTVAFQSDKLGDFSESFVFHLDGCTEHPTVNFCGTVVGPIYEFDVTRIDYGFVSYGFLNGRTLLLSNTCDIPMKYHLYVPEDAESEFSLVPNTGEILPHGKQQVQLDFVAASGSKQYECTLVADVEGPAGDVVGTVKVPLQAESTIPLISLSEDTVDFEDCWNRYKYQRTFSLINDTDLPTRYEVQPQSDASTALALYSVDPPSGVVPAHGSTELTINLATERLGRMNLPVFVQVVGLQLDNTARMEPRDPWLCNVIVNAMGPAVEFDQEVLNWGKLPALKQDSKQITIKNTCLIRAPFQAFIKNRDSVYEVDIRAGVIEPGDSVTLTVSVYLDDTVKFKDELQVIIEEGKTFSVPLSVIGIGTTIYCDKSMKQIDYGNQFTAQTATRVMTLENRGRRALTLSWVNQTTANNIAMQEAKKKALEKAADGKKKIKDPEPIPELFNVLPQKIIMEPMSSYDFVFTSYSKKALPEASELLVCTSIVTKNKGKPKPRPVFETECKANFADPLLEFSSPELKYSYSYVWGEQVAEVQEQPVTLKNVSKLPLSFWFKTEMPFTIDQAEETLSLQPDESITVNTQFDPNFQVDRLSVLLNYPIVIRYHEHPQTDELPIIADIHFPNLLFETSEVIFGCVLNDSVKRVLVNVTNNSTIDADYSWAFVEDADPQEGHLPVNQTFDILPIRGIIKAGETQQVELVYYGHPQRRARATAVCEVVGGPDYELELKGEASDIKFKLDEKIGNPYLVEFAPQVYTKIDEKDFFLFNTGKVDFDFSFSVEKLSRPNLVNMLPMSGRIPAGEKQKIVVKMYPQAPEHIHEYIALQVAHFESVYIIVKGEGIYPKMMLTLPRDPADEEFEALKNEARMQLSTVMPDFNATGKTLSKTGSRQSKRPPSPGGGSQAPSTARTVSMTVKFPTKTDYAQSIEAEAERMYLVKAITDYAADNTHNIEFPMDDSKSMAESRRLDGTMKRLSVLISENQPVAARYILDFGNIILGMSRKRQFSVANIGFPAVSFDLDKRACNQSGFEVEPDKVGKLPGLPEPENIDMSVVFQTHPKYTELGLVELDVPLNVRGGPPVNILMRANVTVPDIEIVNESLDFKRVLCGHRRTICTQLVNNGCVPSEWQVRRPIQGAGDWDFFKCEPESGVIQPGQRVNVQISFVPPDARPYRIKVPFKVTNNNIKTRTCLLKGTGVNLAVLFDPPLVTMGPVLPNAPPISTEVVLSNNSEEPIEIYSVDFDADYLEEEEMLRRAENYGFTYDNFKLYIDADEPEGRPRAPRVGLPDAMIQGYAAEKAAEAAAAAAAERERAIAAGEIDPDADPEVEPEPEPEPPFEPGPSVNVVVFGAPDVGAGKICQLLSSRYRAPVISLDSVINQALTNNDSVAGAAMREAQAALQPPVEEDAEDTTEPVAEADVEPYVPTEDLVEQAIVELLDSSADYEEGVVIDGLTSMYVPAVQDAARVVISAFRTAKRLTRVLVANASTETLVARHTAAIAAAGDITEPVPEEAEAPSEDDFAAKVQSFNDMLPALRESILPPTAEEKEELEDGVEPTPGPGGELRVTIQRCMDDLQRTDAVGAPDPMCRLTMGETSITTEHVPEDRTAPVWEQVITLPVELGKPLPLTVEIVDHDAEGGEEDDLMATGVFDVRELVPGWSESEAAEEAAGLLDSEEGKIAPLVSVESTVAGHSHPGGETIRVLFTAEYSGDLPLYFEVDASADLSTDVFEAVCKNLPEPIEQPVDDPDGELKMLPTTTSLVIARPNVRLPRDVVQHHSILTKEVKPPEPEPELEDGEEPTAEEGQAEPEVDTEPEPEVEPEVEYVFTKKSRWALQPGESVTLQISFTSEYVGVYDELMNFEIVGGTQPVSLLCRSLCAMPKLSKDFRNVYYKKTKQCAAEVANHQYIISRGCFEFGPLLINKFIGQQNIDPVHCDNFRITNSGEFDLHVDFAFQNQAPALNEGDEGYDADAPPPIFLCDPASMDLAIDETQDVKVWAFPRETEPVADKLVCAIMDNPTPLVIPVSCIGAKPQAEVSAEEVVFERIMGGRQETKMISLKNTGLIPFDWQLTDSWAAEYGDQAEGKGLGNEFVLYPSSGTIEPGAAAVVSIEFTPRLPEEAPELWEEGEGDDVTTKQARQFEHDLTLQVFDAEQFLGITQELKVNVKAEVYKVTVEATYHGQPEDEEAPVEHNFGLVKVGESEKRSMAITNKGKYQSGFRFKVAKAISNLFTITPEEGTLAPAGEEGDSVSIEFTFLTDREVTLDKNTEIHLHVFEPMTGEVTEKAAIQVSARSVFSKYKILPGAGVNFGPIIYGTDKTRSVEISNTGEFAYNFVVRATPTLPRRAPILKPAPAPEPSEGDAAAEAEAEPEAEPEEEQLLEDLTIGNFVLSPAHGEIPPGETARVSIVFSPGGSDMFGPSELFKTFLEEVYIDIKNRDYDDKNTGIPFELGGESCIPSINCDDYNQVFEEQELVGQLDPFGSNINVFAVQERAFSYGAIILGESVSQRFKISNTNKIPCNVSLSIRPKLEKEGSEKFAFEVQPASMVIPTHEYRFVTVYFNPDGIQPFAGSLIAEVESGKKQLEFELRGEGNLPSISVVQPTDLDEQGAPLLQFSRTLIGKSQTKQVVLVNNGSVPATVVWELPLSQEFGVIPDASGRGQEFELMPKERAVLHVQFVPSDVGEFKKPLTVSVLRNQFERRVFSLVGEAYTEDVIFENLPEDADDKLDLGDISVGREVTATFTLTNRAAEARRFEWAEVEGFTFSPAVGHIRGHDKKDIVLTFKADAPVAHEAMELGVALVGIQYTEAEDGTSGASLDWDDRMRTVKFVDEERPEDAPEDWVPAQKKVEETAPEPGYEPIADTAIDDKSLKVDVVSDYGKLECEVTELQFKSTMMYQTRRHTFDVTNAGLASIDYRWTMCEPSGAPYSGTYFNVSPERGSLGAGQTAQVSVAFQPLEVDQCHMLLKCEVPNLEEGGAQPPQISCHAASLRPMCHFELPDSDYVTAGRRSDDLRGPGGSVGPLDPDTKVIEFESLGSKVRNTNRFMVLNPTNFSYEFTWKCVDSQRVGSPFRCVNTSGLVLSGKKFEMVFEFTPEKDEPRVQESHWVFTIPEYKVRAPFVLAGTVSEPRVTLSVPHINFQSMLLKGKASKTVTLINSEHIPFSFAFDTSSLETGGGVPPILLEPSSGTVGGESSTEIEVTFCPRLEKVYNFNLPCVVRTKPSPINLNVKGEGYMVHDVLMLEGEDGNMLDLSTQVPNIVEFGQVDINEKRIRPVVIANSGRYNVDFSWSFSNRRSDMRITPELGTVKPGARETCQLEFSPLSEVELNMQAVCSIASGSEYVLALTGTGRKPLLIFSFSLLDFGPTFLHRGGLEPRKAVLEIRNGDVYDISFDCNYENTPQLEVQVSPTVLEPGQVKQVPITFYPRSAVAYEETLAFEINGSYTHNVVITGEGQEPAIELANQAHQNISFGALRVGQEATRTVKMVNRTGVEAVIEFNKLILPKLEGCAVSLDYARTGAAGQMVLKPKESTKVDLRFQPLQRIRAFNQEVLFDVGGVTKQLLVVSGQGVGIDVKLESSTLIFGDVVLNSSVTKQLMIGNHGDIGTRFSWDPEQFRPHNVRGANFSIFPTEGFIPQNDEVKLEITFSPTDLNEDIRLEGLRCNVEGAEPLDLCLTGKSVPEPEAADLLEFACPVRSPTLKSETVSVENPTDVAWSLKPSISHDAWYGDELLNIPAKSKGTYTIWYKPLTMTKDTPHKGYVFFPLPDGSAVTFGLVGNASEPAPLSDTIERSFAAKEPHTESLQVTNWLKTTQRFTVTVERPDEPSTFISYNETFDVSGMQTKEYKMTFNAFKEGTTELKVTFTNPKTGEYVFYELQYTAESAKVLASIPMETRVREPMSVSPFPAPCRATGQLIPFPCAARDHAGKSAGPNGHAHLDLRFRSRVCARRAADCATV